MHELTKLIREDMRPALGVTEPGAIAFAVALARKYVEGEVTAVKVSLNSGMYKNAFTCGIPNSSEYGNLYAAALGAVAADAERGLESLGSITEADNEKAKQLVEEGKIEVILDHMGSEITIDAKVKTAQDSCKVSISGGHTDVQRIEKNCEVIFQRRMQKRQVLRKKRKKKQRSTDIHWHRFLNMWTMFRFGKLTLYAMHFP